MPHDGAEPLFGSDKAQSGFKLYRRHRLLAETRQDIRRMTARDGYICRGVATKNEYNTVELEQYYGYT